MGLVRVVSSCCMMGASVGEAVLVLLGLCKIRSSRKTSLFFRIRRRTRMAVTTKVSVALMAMGTGSILMASFGGRRPGGGASQPVGSDGCVEDMVVTVKVGIPMYQQCVTTGSKGARYVQCGGICRY